MERVRQDDQPCSFAWPTEVIPEESGKRRAPQALYHHAIRSGSGQAAELLATLLVGQGRVDDALALWRARADSGEDSANTMLADLLDEQDRVGRALTHWRASADAGDRAACTASKCSHGGSDLRFDVVRPYRQDRVLCLFACSI
jgi:hypothetical protein